MTTSPRTAAPGHIVLWCPDGRSPATHQRAQDGDCAPLGRLLADSDLVLSICPPAVAEPIAAQVAEAEALLSEAHRMPSDILLNRDYLPSVATRAWAMGTGDA